MHSTTRHPQEAEAYVSLGLVSSHFRLSFVQLFTIYKLVLHKVLVKTLKQFCKVHIL